MKFTMIKTTQLEAEWSKTMTFIVEKVWIIRWSFTHLANMKLNKYYNEQIRFDDFKFCIRLDQLYIKKETRKTRITLLANI